MKVNNLYVFSVESLKKHILDIKTMADSEANARLQVYKYLLGYNFINDNLYYRLKLLEVKEYAR